MKSLFAIILFLSSPLCAFAQVASSNSNPTQINRTLTISEAVRWARQNHPLVTAARQRVAMASGERLEAGLRPNPSLTFSGENFPLNKPENGFNFSRSIDWFATYSQTFETARKRELRVAVAEGDLNYAEAEIAAVERQVTYEVKTAFAQALLARSRVTLARETLTHFQQLVNLNEIRVQAGYTAEGDLIKARLETQRASYQARKAVLDFERAKIALLRAMGENAFVTTFDLQGDLDFEPVSVNMTTLTEAAMKQPQIRAAEARLERAKAAYQLEQAKARPDYTVTFGYKRNGPDNAMYGALSVPLPLFNRNEGLIAKASAAVQAGEADLRFARSMVLAELTLAQKSIESHRNQITALQSDFLKDADESQNISLAAYREGAVELIVLLEAQRARSQALDLFYQSVLDYRLAVFEMERAAGIEQLPSEKQITSSQKPETEK